MNGGKSIISRIHEEINHVKFQALNHYTTVLTAGADNIKFILTPRAIADTQQIEYSISITLSDLYLPQSLYFREQPDTFH